jgi:hypothetical protein
MSRRNNSISLERVLAPPNQAVPNQAEDIMWGDELLSDEREKLLAAHEQRSLDSLSPKTFAKLDVIIIEQAWSLGRALVCTHACSR